ncbi:hypothetical protein [Pelomonas sp. V22]|uniref:hypothetical protein n=1 Tax=Pelomonas sp. V22 TaxID=2822139 RepID=UPI0024A923EA|nr:hypothetical protein [Pelomonas sp. V22]
METPSKHHQTVLRKAARYLVLIDSGGYAVARLFLESREQVAEFDGATEETNSMISGLTATHGASGTEWDKALAGHSAEERAAAEVFELKV